MAATGAPASRDREAGTIVLTRTDVRALLDMESCIAALDDAFRAQAHGETLPSQVLGTHVAGGGFHVKTSGLVHGRAYYAAKINGNFPDNPTRTGLPTIQGVISLHDAVDGRVLAVLDSIEVTSVRTAAATAVAARYLARETAEAVTIIGCGTQGRSQLRALACVRTIRRVYAHDANAETAARYAAEMSVEIGCEVTAVADYRPAVRASAIVVTCTPARRALLVRDDLPPGVFVAAVGADSEAKQELDPSVLANSRVVVDVLEQCATIGDLHHALVAGVMRREDVYAELAEIVAGTKRGREADDDVFVFDSTGTALEDVAAAALIYERAIGKGAQLTVQLGR